MKEKKEFVFKNTGSEVHNDIVYPGPSFELENNSFKLSFEPLTKFWRLGIRFSKTPTIDFYHPAHRYKEPEFNQFKDLLIGVGEWDNANWTLPNRLQLAQYNFDKYDPILKRFNAYPELGKIEWIVEFDNTKKGISTLINAAGIEPFHEFLEIDPEYKYFKIFAWADKIDFEIDFNLEIASQEATLNLEAASNCWLLKLNTDSYNIPDFDEGDEIYFGTLNTKYQRRPEYDSYFNVRKGDKVIGYAFGMYNAAVWLMEVQEGVAYHAPYGESIKLSILESIDPILKYSDFENVIPESIRKEISDSSPVRLVRIDAKIYSNIIGKRLPQAYTNGRKFHFPAIQLSEDERKYLEIIYQNFLINNEISNKYSLREIWNDFPADFNPDKISYLLITGGRDITLWGIWHIDPESELFDVFDKVVYAIKQILMDSNHLTTEITSEQILSQLPSLTNQKIWQAFRLMSSFGSFNRGWGKRDDFSGHISLGDDRIYEQYRKYSGLQTFMLDFLSKNDIKDLPFVNKNKEENFSTSDSFYYSKTPILRRKRADFTPAMGVEALANDLAEIINSLPDEKGQMIGVFGKWGRGKTFLLDELWKVLKTKKDTTYLRVEYHAWKYQETPASWAYLYELLAKEYENKTKGLCNLIAYYYRIIKLNHKRIGISPLIKFIIAVFATIMIWLLTYKKLDKFYTLVIVPITALGLFAFLKQFKKDYSTKAIELIKKYTTRHSFKDTMGIQADIQEELITLLKVWLPEKRTPKRKILLVVEDMDRCTEDRIIQIIDALRVMLDDDEISKRLIILTAIDERILKSAIRTKYTSLISESNHSNKSSEKDEAEIDKIDINELISEYLDKLFISAIKLGSLTALQMQEFLSSLLKNQIEVANKVQGESRSQNTASTESATKGDIDYVSPADIAIRDGDFVLKDGDFALEDTNGNLFSMLDAELNLQNKWEKITSNEAAFLSEVISDWATATPRRISIFYYRYLLCKNLLISKYTNLRIYNKWQDDKSIKILMLLLLKYSNKYDPEIISVEINRVIKLPDSDDVIPKELPANDFAKSKFDYLYLLEIFELVIAY